MRGVGGGARLGPDDIRPVLGALHDVVGSHVMELATVVERAPGVFGRRRNARLSELPTLSDFRSSHFVRVPLVAVRAGVQFASTSSTLI